MDAVSFNVTKHEAKVIQAIARRAHAMAFKHEIDYPLMDASMDVTAVHASDVKLRLEELLEADDFNFMHDVFGIRRHIDRETGVLQNCFLPRYSA